jgi:NADPH:quinone reductase-like Zn-dependent oxidoreductase
VAAARDCIPLKRQVTTDQGASLIVNPFTAYGLLQTARKSRHRAAIQTAAASQLGRMLLAMANDASYPLINIVRRDAQVDLLKSLGAEHVLNSSHEGFAVELKSLSKQLHATIAFDAIAGDMTGTLLNAMPRRSTVYVYGALSEQPCRKIDPVEIVFHGKSVQGFYLGDWLRWQGVIRALRAANYLQKAIIAGHLATQIQRRLKFDEVIDGLRQYVQNMTDGKVLITPHDR